MMLLNTEHKSSAALPENDEVSGSGSSLNGVEIVTGSLMMGLLWGLGVSSLWP